MENSIVDQVLEQEKKYPFTLSMSAIGNDPDCGECQNNGYCGYHGFQESLSVWPEPANRSELDEALVGFNQEYPKYSYGYVESYVKEWAARHVL